jgi:hypothetical protein
MNEQTFTLDEQIGTVADEIGRREYVLRDRVRLRRMLPEIAEREIALMKAVRQTLVELRERAVAQPGGGS